MTGPLAHAATELGYLYAMLSIIVGVAGLAGEMTGLAWLTQPLADWPRTPLLASVALVALGLALIDFLRRRYRFALAASLTAGVAALLSLPAQFASLPYGHQAMPLASAVLVLAAASPMIIISARHRLLPEDAAVGIAGLILLALAATLLVARATGMTDATRDMLGAGPSLQLLVISFLFGSCYVALIWTRGLLSGESATWLPAAIGIAGLVTVTVLWRGLVARENEQVTALTRQAGDERRRVLEREAQVTAHSLRRASEWRINGASLAQQRRDVEALRRDVPGLEAAGWISSGGVVDTATSGVLASAGADSATLAYVRLNGRLPDTIAYLPLDPATQRFAVIAPSCNGVSCTGTMVAIVRTALLFASVVPDTMRGFSCVIIGPAGQLAGPPIWDGSTAKWTQRLPLDLGMVRLTLAAAPTQSTVDGVRSNLPVLVLLMGFAVSGLLGVSVRFAQRALRHARDVERSNLAGALERATDGVWDWDLVTGSAVHSPAIWRYLAYDPATVPPRRDAWLDLVHPDDQSRVRREIDEHLSGARPSFDAEYRVRAKGGEWHTIVDRGRVVERTSGGQPLRMVGIKADVTVARTAEQARDAAEQRFHEIFDSGFQFQFLLDRSGTVMEVNQHALDESGIAGDKVRGRLAWDALWWAENAPAQERLRDAISVALRGRTRRYEETFPAGGTPIYLEIAVKPLTGDSGAATQLLLEARDLTVGRRAEATLREVETLTTMGRVAAQVAHEINNPLAGIQNAFLLIKGAIPESHPHFAYVGAIDREISRISDVTRQLYETYRPELDAKAGAAVSTVVGDAVAFLAQVNRPSGVKIEVRIGGGPPVIPLPAALLRQMVYNLVQNAIEASPPGGIVTVHTESNAERFELRVRDHGPGVPLASREKIFEPFHSTKSGRLLTGGMGLGLALVRRTVAAAGGAIMVTDADGGGCEIVITVPVLAAIEDS